MQIRPEISIPVFLFVAAALFLSGCAATRQLTLVDFQTGQTLQGEFNESARTISVTMPDGEILSGKYSAVTNSSPVYETSVGVGAGSHSHGGVFGTGVAFGGGAGKGYGLLKSGTSGLMMEVVVSYSEWTGHGYGEATTNDGRQYKVQF